MKRIKVKKEDINNPMQINSQGIIDFFLAGSRPIFSVFLAFLVSGVIIIIQGINPLDAFSAIIKGAFGNIGSIANTCVRATPLLIGALGMTLGIRGGIFNVGCEGQLYIGAASATAIGLIPLPVPSWLHVSLALVAGILGGSLFAVLPAYLKAYRGISEIVVTIMLNFVGIYFVSYLIHDPNLIGKAEASYAQSRDILPSAYLPILIKGTSMHLGIIIAVVLALILYFVLKFTRFGYRTRMVGANPEAAHYVGVNVKSSIFTTFLLVGGFSGLMGAIEILGFKHSIFDYFSGGLGYDTVAVSLLGGANPIGVIISALFFGSLRAGGNLMQQTVGVSTYMVQVIQALVVLFIVGIGFMKPQVRKPKSVAQNPLESTNLEG
jgi:general nucleoside transport system permease protein